MVYKLEYLLIIINLAIMAQKILLDFGLSKKRNNDEIRSVK